MVERYRSSQVVERPGFKKGQPRLPNAGRRKGSVNRQTKLVKDAITGAGEIVGCPEPIYLKRTIRLKNGKTKVETTNEIVGWKPSGKGGMQGYMVWLSCHEPRAYATLVGRVIPVQVGMTVERTQTVTERFSGANFKTMTLEEKMAAMREMTGLTLPLPAPKSNHPTVVEGEFTEVPSQEAAE